MSLALRRILQVNALSTIGYAKLRLQECNLSSNFRLSFFFCCLLACKRVHRT